MERPRLTPGDDCEGRAEAGGDGVRRSRRARRCRNRALRRIRGRARPGRGADGGRAVHVCGRRREHPGGPGGRRLALPGGHPG
nr:MAG: hypothetical protein DIU60_17815 [Actinomycetota bacterium]